MCSECKAYGGSCPCCSEDVYEPETFKCVHCLKEFEDTSEMTVDPEGQPTCKKCRILIDAGDMMLEEEREKTASINWKELFMNLNPVIL